VVASKVVESLSVSNILGGEVSCETHAATQGLLIVVYSEYKKVVVATAAIELFRLQMDKLTD